MASRAWAAASKAEGSALPAAVDSCHFSTHFVSDGLPAEPARAPAAWAARRAQLLARPQRADEMGRKLASAWPMLCRRTTMSARRANDPRRRILEADQRCARLQRLRRLLVGQLALLGALLWIAALWPKGLERIQSVVVWLWIPAA